MANKNSKPKKAKQPMGKGKKIAIITISAALLVGGGVTAYLYSGQIGEFIDKWFHDAKIAKVDSEYQIEKGVVEDEEHPETVLPYKYLGSAETSFDFEDQSGPVPTTLSAHTFLIGRVSQVPFYQSGWTKFDYENIGMTISFSEINSKKIETSLSTTNERSESSSWSQSTHFQEKFVASAEAKLGPVKLKAENTIDYQVDKSSSSTSMQRYVSSNEQTNASIDTLQKTSDYTIELNSRNGFKKGKYYRMTLQQTASMYMVVYELQDKAGTIDTNITVKDPDDPTKTVELKPGDKFYKLTSFLADPSNYTMVVEETDNPSLEPKVPEGERFDPTLYEECVKYIDEVGDRANDLEWVIEKAQEEPPSRYEQLAKEGHFDELSEVKSDFYYRNTEWRITDAGKEKNHSDKVTFPTLFKSKGAPTFAELFNESNQPPEKEKYKGFDFKYVDIEIQFDYREYDDGYQHMYLVDKSQGVIKEERTDISKSWRQKRIVWEGIDAIDKLRTTMDPQYADGWIHVMYDGSGKHDDDWGIKNFMMQVTIRKA